MPRINMYERQNVEWPLNLVYTIFAFAGDDTIPESLPPDIERTLIFVVCGLRKDRGNILMMYYHEHMTTYEIAEDLGTSHQDAAYDLRTALEAIANSPRNMMMLRHGIIACLDRRIREAYDAGYADAYYIGYKDGESHAEPEYNTLDIHGMDLSVRSTNCLLRANFRTAEEVACADSRRIALIRNLGRNAAEEIYFKLKALGFEPKWDLVGFSKAMNAIAHEKYTKQKKE